MEKLVQNDVGRVKVYINHKTVDLDEKRVQQIVVARHPQDVDPDVSRRNKDKVHLDEQADATGYRLESPETPVASPWAPEGSTL